MGLSRCYIRVPLNVIAIFIGFIINLVSKYFIFEFLYSVNGKKESYEIMEKKCQLITRRTSIQYIGLRATTETMFSIRAL